MRSYVKGVPIQDIIDDYNRTGNVWKVGKHYGISGQTIHSVLSEANIINKMNYFSKEDEAILVKEYEQHRVSGTLQELADKLHRTKQFICRKAKSLGLTGKVKHYDYSDEKHLQLSESSKLRIRKYGHPRGALGMKHSDEAKSKMSEATKKYWRDNYDSLHDAEHRKMRSDVMMELQEKSVLGIRSRTTMINASIGGKSFLAKSTWEYNIALYLQNLKERGYIDDWSYEPEQFVFKYNILGIRSYKPDFGVKRFGVTYYVEVKGWEDDKYKIKKSLMEEEYPEVPIVYIRQNAYRQIEHKYSKILNSWK